GGVVHRRSALCGRLWGTKCRHGRGLDRNGAAGLATARSETADLQANVYRPIDFGGHRSTGEVMSYVNPDLLWSVDELKNRLTDSKLVLMDMRPPEAYANAHIPGARSFDIFGISLIDTRPEPLAAFLWLIEHLIQAKGVNSDSTVVLYDDVAGMRSARLFWFLEYFGHDDVHMLNGGFNAWRDAGLPVTQEAVVVLEP